MYLSSRMRGLGQDDDSTSVLDTVTNPVSLSVSPLMLAGLGLFFFASLAHFTKRTTKAVARKGKAIRKALKA